MVTASFSDVFSAPTSTSAIGAHTEAQASLALPHTAGTMTPVLHSSCARSVLCCSRFQAIAPSMLRRLTGLPSLLLSSASAWTATLSALFFANICSGSSSPYFKVHFRTEYGEDYCCGRCADFHTASVADFAAHCRSVHAGARASVSTPFVPHSRPAAAVSAAAAHLEYGFMWLLWSVLQPTL